MGTAQVWEGLRRFKKAFKPVGGNHDIAFLKEPAEEIRTRENPTLASHGIPTPTIHAYPPAERWFRNSCGSRWIEVDTSLAVVPAGWPMMAHHLVAPQASVDVVPPRGARTVGARRGGQQHGVLERHLARLPRQSTRSRYAMQLVSVTLSRHGVAAARRLAAGEPEEQTGRTLGRKRERCLHVCETRGCNAGSFAAARTCSACSARTTSLPAALRRHIAHLHWRLPVGSAATAFYCWHQWQCNAVA